MCLHIPPGYKETIAKEDIICYKIAKRITYKNHPSGKNPDPVVVTPFRGVVITEDMIKDGDPMTPKCRTRLQVYPGAKHPNERNAGWIHVLCDKKNAIGILQMERKMDEKSLNTSPFFCSEWILFECAIPKGTRYVYGVSAWGGGYASKKIVFKKEIKVE